MNHAAPALFAVLLLAGAARAQGAITLEDCAKLDGELLRELFRLELRTLGLEQTRFEVVVGCEQQSATIRVPGAVTGGAPARASVDLSRTTPTARERLVALAASELVTQAEREQQREPERVREPAPAREDATVDSGGNTARRSGSLPLLYAGAALTTLADPTTLLLGPLLGTRVPLSGPLSLGIETRYELGTTDTTIASVDFSLLTASLLVWLELGDAPVGFSVAPGLRGGFAALDASAVPPATGERVTGPWLGAGGAARASFTVTEHLVAFTGGEAGCVVVPVRGTVDDAEVLVDGGGCYFGGSAGAGYAF